MKEDTKCCDEQRTDNEGRREFSTHLQKSIENIIKKEGFTSHETYKRMLSTDGGSYVGELYAIDVKGKTVDGDKETNIFVKKIIAGAEDSMKDMFSITDVFSVELYAYTELSKIFTELQDKVNVPEDDRYKMVKAYDESSTEAILLENMAKKGFKTNFRMDLMSLKFAELSIEQLAKFHALAFVLEKQNPSYVERKLRPLKYPYRWDDFWRTTCRNTITATVNSIEDKDLRKKAEEFIPIALEKYPTYYNIDETPISCLCHGDFRPNNILKKEVDGEVTEVIPVDYQVMYYGCPVNDIIYFIFFGSDGKLRREHLSDLLDLYYRTLTKFLLYFDMDVNQVFPRKVYDVLIKERLDFGLIISLNFGGFLFAEDGDIFEMGEGALQNWKPKMDVRIQSWIRDAIEDCTRCDYL